MSIDLFKKLFTDFVAGNSSRIQQAYASKGGWEKWLQAELAMSINAYAAEIAKFGKTVVFDFDREVTKITRTPPSRRTSFAMVRPATVPV